MDFFTLIAFLALYYLRPQEWLSDFNVLHPVQLLSVLAFWAMLQNRRLNFKTLLRTPLDWLMLCYFLWTLIAGLQPKHTFDQIQAVLLFYFVGACSLDSIPRLKKYLGWWCFFMFAIAALAILSVYGFDPLHGNDITEGAMKGRLILNLSVFDNPNALAHSVIPVVPLFYYLFYWRQVASKALMLLLAAPLYCVFLTQSKGAFVCGFATILATLTFGRSRIWQVIILLLAIGFGYSALFMLPRMNELNSSKTDPAIQGRIAAFTYGLELMRGNWFGIGLGNFESSFLHFGPLEKEVRIRIIPAKRIPLANGAYRDIDARRIPLVSYHHYSKATHSAYNQNGAELGYTGLFLFVGIIYCCMRTLLLVKSKDDDEERIRRALFAMVVAYAASSWMVDFCYRPTFFLMVAAISAFHRHLLRKHETAAETVEAPAAPVRPWLRRFPPLGLPGIPLPGLAAAASIESPASFPEPIPSPMLGAVTLEPALVPVSGAGPRMMPWQNRSSFEETLRRKFKWTRLGMMDFAIMLVLTYAAIRYWEHLIVTM